MRIFYDMEENNLKILFASSECTPTAKVGGLADVIGSLPGALKKLDLDVRIVIPKYKTIDEKKYYFRKIDSKVKVKEEFVNIYQGFLPESNVPIYLLENEKYFGENGIYFERTAFVGSFKEIQRFLFFSQAVLEIFPNFHWSPSIIHCHDWHTAILPVLAKLQIQPPTLDRAGGKIKNLLTIHNLANQGRWEAKEIFDFLKLKGDEFESFKIRDRYGNFNILEQGILNADLLNTVSPTYAKEILTKECGEELEKSLLKRKKELCGILNGIDESRFNPAADPNLKKNYSLKNLEKKTENKTELQEILNLAKNPTIPLFGLISRLTPQKGIDLLIEIIPELIKRNCQLAILGVGSADYEKKLLELSQKYPENVSSQIKFDSVLAQKIYAGSDIFLMPSKFEPCGLGQMISMRYGTIPIGRKTGGLADTIKNKKTGFFFEKYESEALLETIKEALKCYQKQKKWNEMIKTAMSEDFSWQKSAQKYLKLYKKLTKS